MAAKILYLDIETAPKLAYVWEFWKQNINTKAVLEHGHIMSFSAIWNDSPDEDIIYEENRQKDDFEIVSKLIQLLDEADIVVGHNIRRFDCPEINGRALVAELPPPSPYKIIDTCDAAKRTFRFGSNSLDYLSHVLKVKHKKQSHAKYPGFELWLACIRGDNEAWEEMKEYNINDTLAVRDVYYAMCPWIPNHPNVSVYSEEESLACPACGSEHLHSRGYSYTSVGKYQRYRCTSCGKWSRSRKMINTKEKRDGILVNV